MSCQRTKAPACASITDQVRRRGRRQPVGRQGDDRNDPQMTVAEGDVDREAHSEAVDDERRLQEEGTVDGVAAEQAVGAFEG